MLKPLPSPLMKPILVFVNPKSGGNQVRRGNCRTHQANPQSVVFHPLKIIVNMLFYNFVFFVFIVVIISIFIITVVILSINCVHSCNSTDFCYSLFKEEELLFELFFLVVLCRYLVKMTKDTFLHHISLSLSSSSLPLSPRAPRCCRCSCGS